MCRESDHLEDFGIDGSVLTFVFMKQGRKV